ncbi:MAG: thioredoxin family protein [Spirochaetaceae bacterium 4572_59]|nr:MAG: thioredoxin family protein [Spirochaetaceae bacterium 4572_59]
MNIQILGMGCPKCKTLEKNAREAVSEMGIEAEIVKIADMQDIMKMGVMMTPALAIDNDVKTSGKVLTKGQIIDILKEVG